jgi:hypothetical protein
VRHELWIKYRGLNVWIQWMFVIVTGCKGGAGNMLAKNLL